MSTLENESVKKVRAALIETGVGDNVIELEETARSAEEAAKSLGVELGSIVKSLVFLVDEVAHTVISALHLNHFRYFKNRFDV